MRRKRQPSKKLLLKRSININNGIRAQELRVLDEEGAMLGVLSREEALTRARGAGTDLVEVAPAAKPPVAKLIDFNKYLYLLAKKERGTANKGKSEVKEIKIGLFMAEHDVARLAKKAGEFLQEGHQVRINLWLKGRELTKKDWARAFLYAFAQKIEKSKIASEPSMQGKVMRMVISFENKKKNEQTKN